MRILEKIFQFFQEIRQAALCEPPLRGRWNHEKKNYGEEAGEHRPT